MNAYSFEFPSAWEGLAERRYQDAIEHADAAHARAYEILDDEMAKALMFCPSRIVQTPGFGPRPMTAADVVFDNLSGTDGDASWNKLLVIVGAAARGLNVKAAASEWIEAEAKRHAAFHAGDLAEGL